ncbi:MAG: 16S rRNA processing protein RimM [Clostridiales bacterium]|nr:16S rRNA processing protein RimM [Clostridiales bacterium]
MTKYLEIGQIVNTFGIKGMVKVKPFTDNIERFNNLEKIYIKNKSGQTEYKIQEIKYHKNMVLIKFEGIENPEQADLLRNSYLIVDRETEEPLEPGRYYIVDMIGLDVFTDDNEYLGKLEDIYNTGSNDIYVVKNELGKQVLLPAIEDVIKNIDMDNKKVIVHLIPGLV